MYSLQLRRGIVRGRILQTSALYNQTSHQLCDEQQQYLLYNHNPPHTREFHASRRLSEDDKKDGGSGGADGGDGGGKPRVIPKMNFAELVKKAGMLRQSVFKKPPEASATFNPAAPPPPSASNAATAAATPPPTSTTPRQPPQLDPNVTFKPDSNNNSNSNSNSGNLRIRRYGVNATIDTELISSASQQYQTQQETSRRVGRQSRQRTRNQQQQQEQPSFRRPEEPKPLTISDREAQAQDRAFAQAGAFVKGYNAGERGGQTFRIKRVDSTDRVSDGMDYQERLKAARIARGVSPYLAGDAKQQQQQQQQRAFEEDEEEDQEGVGRIPRQQQKGPRITPLPVRVGGASAFPPRGPRIARARGPRGMTGGGGGGGGGGGKARGPRKRSKKAAKSLREAERLAEEEMEAKWLEITGNPKRGSPTEVEPHPVYDTTKPYFADVGDLSRWIPAMGGGASEAARKLQWVGKPKSEKMLEYAGKALLGDGILVPGQVWKIQLPEGVKVTREAEVALSTAEVGLMKNPTIGGKNQAKFLEIVKGKVGISSAQA